MSGNLIRNIGWLGTAHVLVKPLWFLFVTAVLMRLLGADGYGVMSAALALAGLVLTFTDLGMSRYTARAVSRDRSVASMFMSNFLALRTVLIVLGLAVAVCAGWMLGYVGIALWAVFFAAVYTAALTLTGFLRSLYDAVEALKPEALLLIIEKILVVGLGVAFVLSVRQANYALSGMALGMVLAMGLHVIVLHRTIAPLRPQHVSTNFIRQKLPLMIPLGLAGLFSVAYYKIDLVMVESMIGDTEAGQYGAAYRILEALSMLPTVVVLSGLFPRLTRLEHEHDNAGFRKLLRLGFAGLSITSVAISALLALVAPQLIYLLSPEANFAPAADALRVLAWTFPLVCTNLLLYSALVIANRERFLAVTLFAVLIFNVVANLVAIPALGIRGAAITTVASEGLLAVTYFVRFWQTRS